MASKTLTEQVRELRDFMMSSEQRLSNIEKELDRHDLLDMQARLRVVEDRVAELAKARELAGNRLFQIGVAILTAQFALIIAIISVFLRK